MSFRCIIVDDDTIDRLMVVAHAKKYSFLDIAGEGRICECTEPKIEKGVACLYTSLSYNFDNQHNSDSCFSTMIFKCTESRGKGGESFYRMARISYRR